MGRFAELFGRPTFLRQFHGWATIFWIAMAPPSMLTGLRHSVMYLVGLSVYAIVVGHWSSWQAARVEVKQDEQIDQIDSSGDRAADTTSSTHQEDQ